MAWFENDRSDDGNKGKKSLKPRRPLYELKVKIGFPDKIKRMVWVFDNL